MRQVLSIFLLCLTAVLSASAQQQANYESVEALQRDVTFLLLEKNLDDVVKQLETEPPTTVASLLRRLVIYSRAARPSLIRATLERLPVTPNWQCPNPHDVRSLIRNAAGVNMATQRFYYERLCPDDIEGAEAFVRLWSSNGDATELDAWLAQRSNVKDEWLMLRAQVRGAAGTAGELLDSLAAEVRANPSDWKRVDRYLRANNRAGNLQDLSWLADAFELNTAGDTFQLGERLRPYSPPAAAKLYRKSLDLPFTDADAKLVDDLVNRFRSYGPSLKLNWEKQLRYWTKRGLAEAYQRMNQPLAAQPLVEELAAVKGDDVLLPDVHQLAGAVQAGSGQRVVEGIILRDENARRATSEYWLERTNYYEGRGEYQLERDSFRQALVALAAKADDEQGLGARFEVVRRFAFFLAEENNGKEDRLELEKLLTVELRSTPPETFYACQIARLLVLNDLELGALRDSLLSKQPAFFARLLDGRAEWNNDESYLIHDVIDQETVPPALRDKLWSGLERLVRDPGSTRAFGLADAMHDSEEWQRAIPLWRGYFEHAPATSWEGYKTTALENLLTAYCRTKQWQAAEKLLTSQRESFWRNLPKALAEIAVAAAQQNAIDDAMRLWQMSTNLDRQNLDALPQLAQTKLKPHLLAMYSRMKKDDPLSTIPDLALQLLQ